MKRLFFGKTLLLASVIAVAGSCAPSSVNVGLTDALDDSAWDASVWISAADAPVFEGRVSDGTRAADGASWFVSTVANDAKVVSAKWMTAGLGV